MEKDLNTNYVKRTQKDYSQSFKLQIVREVESGEFSASAATKRYGIQDDRTVANWIKK